jgi:hypothetical protein
MTTNASFCDKWTPAHAVSGALLNIAGLSYPQFLMASIAFELLEHSMESPRGNRLFGTKRPESPINVAGDLISGTAGYLLAQALRK